MKTSVFILGTLLLCATATAGTVHASFRNSSTCSIYATFVRDNSVVSGGFCIAPGNAEVVTYTYQPGTYWWIAEPAIDGGCIQRIAHLTSPSVDATVDSWVVGTCTNVFIPPECDCFAVLSPKGSPYHGTTNTTPHNLVNAEECTPETQQQHWAPVNVLIGASDPIDDPDPDHVVVRNGETIALRWPTCCTTGWAIAWEGFVYCYTNGALASTQPVTLAVPNWQGVLPCAQHGTTNTPATSNHLMPPWSAMFSPLFTTNYNTGYNGGIWKAAIICGNPPFWFFEETHLFSCNRPVAVLNWGNSDPMQLLYDSQENHKSPPCSIWPFHDYCGSITNTTSFINWSMIRNVIHP